VLQVYGCEVFVGMSLLGAVLPLEIVAMASEMAKPVEFGLLKVVELYPGYVGR
jgi:hypothetical protein